MVRSPPRHCGRPLPPPCRRRAERGRSGSAKTQPPSTILADTFSGRFAVACMNPTGGMNEARTATPSTSVAYRRALRCRVRAERDPSARPSGRRGHRTPRRSPPLAPGVRVVLGDDRRLRQPSSGRRRPRARRELGGVAREAEDVRRRVRQRHLGCTRRLMRNAVPGRVRAYRGGHPCYGRAGRRSTRAPSSSTSRRASGITSRSGAQPMHELDRAGPATRAPRRRVRGLAPAKCAPRSISGSSAERRSPGGARPNGP